MYKLYIISHTLNPEQRKRSAYTCFNPTLGQIWTNPTIGLHFLMPFLTQLSGLSIFDPNLV